MPVTTMISDPETTATVVLKGGIAAPLSTVVYVLVTPNTGWLFGATAVAYFLSYEWLHLAYHLPLDHWAAKLPGMAVLRRHHTLHHRPSLMTKWNFNVNFPIWDKLMGTYYRPEAAEKPQKT